MSVCVSTSSKSLFNQNRPKKIDKRSISASVADKPNLRSRSNSINLEEESSKAKDKVYSFTPNALGHFKTAINPPSYTPSSQKFGYRTRIANTKTDNHLFLFNDSNSIQLRSCLLFIKSTLTAGEEQNVQPNTIRSIEEMCRIMDDVIDNYSTTVETIMNSDMLKLPLELIDYIMSFTNALDFNSPYTMLRIKALEMLKILLMSHTFLTIHISLATPTLVSNLLKYLSQSDYEEDSMLLAEIFVNFFHKNKNLKNIISKAVISYLLSTLDCTNNNNNEITPSSSPSSSSSIDGSSIAMERITVSSSATATTTTTVTTLDPGFVFVLQLSGKLFLSKYTTISSSLNRTYTKFLLSIIKNEEYEIFSTTYIIIINRLLDENTNKDKNNSSNNTSNLKTSILKSILKYWPVSNSTKEQSFIVLLASIFQGRSDLINEEDIKIVIRIIFVVLKWSKYPVVHDMFEWCKSNDVMDLFRKNRSLFSKLMAKLEMINKTHWSVDVRKETSIFLCVICTQFNQCT